MKKLLRLFKPMFKKVLVAQMAANEGLIIGLILKQAGNKIPLSGEALENTVKVLYDALEEIITVEIDKI